MSDTIIGVLRDKAPVAFAYLVGSQARDRTMPMSDVDVAVYFSRPNNKLTGLASGLSIDLQTALKRSDVDVIELNRAGIPILASIMKYAKPLVIRNVDAEKDFKRRTYQKIVDFQPTLELIGQRTIRNIREGAKA